MGAFGVVIHWECEEFNEVLLSSRECHVLSVGDIGLWCWWEVG